MILAFGLMIGITASAQGKTNRYALYQTGDCRNYLLLDTSTGLIQQYGPRKLTERKAQGYMYLPQYSLKGFVNRVKLNNDIGVPGRFNLRETGKGSMFILTDTTDGRRWEVHYGKSQSDRYISRITE